MAFWVGRWVAAIRLTAAARPRRVRHETTAASEQGRGLQIVEALSAHWGWNHEQGGKAVYAILAKEG